MSLTFILLFFFCLVLLSLVKLPARQINHVKNVGLHSSTLLLLALFIILKTLIIVVLCRRLSPPELGTRPLSHYFLILSIVFNVDANLKTTLTKPLTFCN